MAVTPPNLLPPESQPWARDRDTAIAQLQFDAAKNAQSTDNSFSAVNQALASLAAQVSSTAAAAAAASSAASAAASAAGTANAAVADLAARVSITQMLGVFNTGTLPNDSTWHQYGATTTINVAVPTGKVLIMVGCSEASMSGTSVASRVSFSSTSAGISWGTYDGRNFQTGSAIGVSSPLILVRAFSVTPGNHNFTLQMGAWSASAGASVNFRDPFITVQVTA